jgi:DNA-binding transcriptional regulator YdaS (Cro superfamily)
MNISIQKAVKIAGGQSALARKCGVEQGYIWYWLHRAKKTPAEIVLKIEAATDGQITRYEMRPDLYPPDDTA